jgi:ketosteroid isomerase-like protein
MKRTISLLLTLSLLVCSEVLATRSCLASPFAERDLLAANSEFYAALNSVFRGDAKAMEEAWSHAQDVSYMGPDGLRHLGWDSVRADWALLASKRLGGTVQLAEVRVQPGDSMASVSGIEVGENVVDDQPHKFSIRATNIFRKEEGKWKLIAHHTDKVPYLGK